MLEKTKLITNKIKTRKVFKKKSFEGFKVGIEFALFMDLQRINSIEPEKVMVNPVSNTSKPLITAPDSQRQKNSSQEYNEYASINVEFSEQAKKVKIFEEGSNLTNVLKSEFDQVFGLDESKKELFLERLDHILADN